MPDEEEFTPHRTIVCLGRAGRHHVQRFVDELENKRNVAEVICLSRWATAKLYVNFAVRMQSWKLKENWSISWQEMLRTSESAAFQVEAGVIASEVLCKALGIKKLNSVAFVVTLPGDLRTGHALVCAIEAWTTATGIVMESFKHDLNSVGGDIFYRGPKRVHIS